eukprot:CAMPEP_0113844414 /NCGR_PEP_ID=MMETSP0372-20130328/226_1 /TAXON_ID=340204 /ORGANISM="Lankesteria abbotti" /LENGTH=335 /DNA_ID=CAMNT_0000813419 /DNA_START=127 /DNA_END=1134 /DNA_ORIENTATION=- /assembly_acc=CAM_ASM_000359
MLIAQTVDEQLSEFQKLKCRVGEKVGCRDASVSPVVSTNLQSSGANGFCWTQSDASTAESELMSEPWPLCQSDEFNVSSPSRPSQKISSNQRQNVSSNQRQNVSSNQRQNVSSNPHLRHYVDDRRSDRQLQVENRFPNPQNQQNQNLQNQQNQNNQDFVNQQNQNNQDFADQQNQNNQDFADQQNETSRPNEPRPEWWQKFIWNCRQLNDFRQYDPEFPNLANSNVPDFECDVFDDWQNNNVHNNNNIHNIHNNNNNHNNIHNIHNIHNQPTDVTAGRALLQTIQHSGPQHRNVISALHQVVPHLVLKHSSNSADLSGASTSLKQLLRIGQSSNV